MKYLLSILLVAMIATAGFAQSPMRLAVAGLSHGHVGWAFNRSDKKDAVLVGVYEPNQELVDRFAAKYRLDKKL
ncbi:MAG: gfo/Idh/MocA family oxidoreductase, partial [Dyadobacter sp.]